MARPGYVKIIYFPIAILVLLAAYFIFSSLAANADTPASIQGGQVVEAASDEKKGEHTPITTEPVKPQATQDGQTILNKRCTACHVNASFDEMDKTRAEWEETLAMMEAMGLQLSRDEKGLLLEYLSEP